ncbi:MAG: ATP-binding protein, partial [Pseudomonadota bacterium]
VEVYRKEFVANVTHELKTPLFNIQGYIHSLIDGALYDKEVNHIFLEKASKNVDRLVTLVSDLEIISQLETGGAIFEHEVFDIYDLVTEVFESLEFKAAAKKKYLSIETGADKQYYVSADKDKIRQVFVNLIENSIKYGIQNGRTWINFIDADENLLIEICDDGPGIPEEHLQRLFERFYRVDKSRSRDAGGTGLGLAIVRHIIEGHHKTINVKSKVGEGTVFSFSLDRKKN